MVVVLVDDADIGKLHPPVIALNGAENLLVNAVLESMRRMVQENLYVVHLTRPHQVQGAGLRAHHLHAERVHVRCNGTFQQLHDGLAGFRRNHVIRIDPDDKFALGILQGLIARRREVVTPGEVVHLRAQLAANLVGAVGASGVQDD